MVTPAGMHIEIHAMHASHKFRHLLGTAASRWLSSVFLLTMHATYLRKSKSRTKAPSNFTGNASSLRQSKLGTKAPSKPHPRPHSTLPHPNHALIPSSTSTYLAAHLLICQ